MTEGYGRVPGYPDNPRGACQARHELPPREGLTAVIGIAAFKATMKDIGHGFKTRCGRKAMKKRIRILLSLSLLGIFAPTLTCGPGEPDYEDLAGTPPMGWNSWNRFACDVSEKLIKETADAMVATGPPKRREATPNRQCKCLKIMETFRSPFIQTPCASWIRDNRPND